MPSQDPTQRFSDRVQNYVKYRPGYPAQAVEVLHAAGLKPAAPVADLGSGTGILSQLLLDHGHPVFAVEPNAEMRQAAEAQLGQQPGFHSLDGRAEAIPLPDASVAYIVAGQAFHWFQPQPARREMARVLQPGGGVALIWNQRDTHSAFQADYEQLLLDYCGDFARVDHQRNFGDEIIEEFFAPSPVAKTVLNNHQLFDLEGLRGRLLSSSYAPLPGSPDYEPAMAALDELFQRYKKNGQVRFEYLTVVYTGSLT